MIKKTLLPITLLACVACTTPGTPPGTPTCGPPLEETDVLLVDATEAFEAGGKAAALQAAEEAAGPFRLLGDDYFKVDSNGFINQEYPTKSSRAAAIVLQASAGQGCDLAIVFQQMNVGEGGMSARIRFYLAERTP
jgi:hypothetical protein